MWLAIFTETPCDRLATVFDSTLCGSVFTLGDDPFASPSIIPLAGHSRWLTIVTEGASCNGFAAIGDCTRGGLHRRLATLETALDIHAVSVAAHPSPFTRTAQFT